MQPGIVLQDILKQLREARKAEVMGMNKIELVRELNKVQTEKKCLIVIDDIWEINHWKMLSKAFVDADQTKSKILLTTRKEQVAELRFAYKLQNLTQNESWELFQKKAFFEQVKSGVKVDEDFEIVGREIVEKCGRLPLAISVLGGILKSRNTLSDWQKVSADVDLYLSEGDGSKQGLSGSPIDVLGLSYNDLPYNLKSCFLYMGIFKEDKEINARELYHMWTAEGMLSSKHRGSEETMMDLAKRHLSELASRSMVQVTKMDEFCMVGSIIPCKLHDLMRDLCLKKGEEEGFLENINNGTPFLSKRNAHRLTICPGENRELFLEQITMKFLRALSVCDTADADLLQGPLSLKSCRVLHFHKCPFHGAKLPKEISLGT